MERSIEYWKEYYLQYSKLKSFSRRINKSIEIIKEFLGRFPNSYISWSGGKDSTAMLHLILQIMPNIKVMTEKDTMDFPEELEYVQSIKEKYNLNLDIISPDIDLWDVIQNYDILNDIHSRNTKFSQDYFYSLIKQYKEDNNYNGVFLGLRSEESKGRKINKSIRGFIYKRGGNEYVCQPIANWTGKDVFAYLFINNIPILSVYFKTKFVKSPEQIRKSWILPSHQSTKGQVSWLKYYYPNIFNKLSKINNKIRSYS